MITRARRPYNDRINDLRMALAALVIIAGSVGLAGHGPSGLVPAAAGAGVILGIWFITAGLGHTD